MAISGANTDSQNQAVKVGNPVIYNTPAPASYGTTVQLLLASDIIGGIILMGNASAIAATMPTASLLAGAMRAILGSQFQIGDTIECLLIAGMAGAITITLGTGMTFDGTNQTAGVVAGNSSKYIAFRFTGITPGSETCVLYS